MTKVYIVFFALTSILFLNIGFSQTTYTSISDGAYSDCSNWSGGVCPPSSIPSGDEVIINHKIKLSGILKVGDGATLTNNNTLAVSMELHIDGLFTNIGDAFPFRVHNDGVVCNSGNITLDPGETFINHNGTIDCGGTINACSWHILGIVAVANQTICCGVGLDPNFPTGIVGVDYSTIVICSLLPVELVNFGLDNKENSILLNWETKSELNNDYFVILRSENGIYFEEIGEVDGMSNSSSPVNYQFSDERPLIGTSYYKLKQIDFDGEISFSQVLRTNFTLRNVFSLYPNPTNSDINLLLSVDHNTTIYIEVFDALGGLVFVQNQAVLNGTNSVPLHIEVFNEGVYFCRVTFPNGNHMKQTFVKID